MRKRLDALLSPRSYQRFRAEALKQGRTPARHAADIIRAYCDSPANFVAFVPVVMPQARVTLSVELSLECRRLLEQSTHGHFRNKNNRVEPQDVLARAIELHFHVQDVKAAAEAARRARIPTLPPVPDHVRMPRKAPGKFKL